MHSLGEQSTRQIQSSYRQTSFHRLAHFHVGIRLLLICTLNSLLSNFKHPTKGVLTTLPRGSASDKTGPFHNNQQKILLVKMSAHYQGQAKEYKDQICGKHWGEEGDDNISSLTGGGKPVRMGLLSGSSWSALGVVGLVYQEGLLHCLKGWVVSELFQQLKRELSTGISPIVVQIYSGKGRG